MNVTALTAPAATSNWKRVGWILLLLGGVFAAGNAVMFMLVDGHGSSRHQGPLLRHGARRLGARVGRRGRGADRTVPADHAAAHVVAAECTCGWGGRTCSRSSPARWPGLYFAPKSTAGLVGSIGFTTLAMFWLYSGAQAYIAIRRGNVQVHRRWMLRNYALTFAAATLRIELPLLIIGGVRFPAAYTMVAWISWVPNWLTVEAWLRKSKAAPR